MNAAPLPPRLGQSAFIAPRLAAAVPCTMARRLERRGEPDRHLARRIAARVAARTEKIKSPDDAAAMAEEFRKTVLGYEGDDALAKCKRDTEGWVDIGGNQDELAFTATTNPCSTGDKNPSSACLLWAWPLSCPCFWPCVGGTTPSEFRLEKNRTAGKLWRMSNQARLGRSTNRLHAGRTLGLLLACSVSVTAGRAASPTTPLRKQLESLPFKIAYECYTNDNWEIFVMNADGAKPVNLTCTPKQHEHYPQVSPDGTQLCFSVDEGEGRDAVRSLWVMEIDGKTPKKLVDHAREPFWRPDSKAIGFLPQEYPKFNVIDYYTTGMSFYELATGRIQPHPNSPKLHHLYNPGFAPNGKWIVSTVHAGMAFDHAILLIEAKGNRIVNLKIPGCRPCLSPDGRQIAWGSGDHEIVAAPIDLDADLPAVGPWRLRIQDQTNEIYHVDWSPDGRFLSFSRGPASKGDPTKPGTFQAACEIVGVYAPGWDLCVVSAERSGILDLNNATEAEVVLATKNGCSNKESAWVGPNRIASKSR